MTRVHIDELTDWAQSDSKGKKKSKCIPFLTFGSTLC
jgi:hypothetical protein